MLRMSRKTLTDYRLSFLFATMVTIACVPQAIQGSGGSDMKRLEPLHTVSFQEDYVEITVIGNGCTLAKHFDIQARLIDSECWASIYRTQPDMCRRMPMPVSLKVPWNSKKICGAATIKVQNSLSRSNGSISANFRKSQAI